MELQKLLWPRVGICTEETLYYRIGPNLHRAGMRQSDYLPVPAAFREEGDVLVLSAGSQVAFDTYFNSLSSDKWRLYTTAHDFGLELQLSGRLRVRLCSRQLVNDISVPTVLEETVVDCEAEQSFRFAFPANAGGMLYFELQALRDDARYYGGRWTCEAGEEQNVKIGLDICTFKREPFVMGNIARIRRAILDNPASPMHGHLEVFVSDNGKTLDRAALNSDTVHVVANANLGGAGGFTRGMIEVLKANEAGAGITHVLVMDDDIVLDTEVLVRTYNLLRLRRPGYEQLFVGGAMLRLDRPWQQVECGAVWNAGQLISHKANFNLSDADFCVANELIEAHEYNAWWYCCIPIQVIRPDNLPMPIFIRGDDVEYGLRNCRQLATLNGICVWHEPFESKYSSSMYYYILRNQCIDNSLHYPEYNAASLKADLRAQVMGEVNRYRYRNADLLIRGVRDFLKGIDWLKQVDAEALHKEIMAYGYKSVPVEKLDLPFDYSRYRYTVQEEPATLTENKQLKVKLTRNGWLVPPTREYAMVSMVNMTAYSAYRVKKIVNYDVNTQKAFITERSLEEYHRCRRELKACLKEIDARFDAAAASYHDRCGELQNLSFWKHYLGLED
ncbi:MAG: glycosyltransferase [Gemmiger sp.]|uniref:glycosyltransferase n=1 Tax=Gemmiger sp. TaxID=2049027 RepID=UPI002E787D45|nr:glycosyltransferase [Gemmiger sp.]MEE0800072.1 glycosyltransferase [Gemmiger sp.]